MPNTTWSPTDKAVGITLTNLNLTATNSNNAIIAVRAADKHLAGKFYWEVTATTATTNNDCIGIAGGSVVLTNLLTTAAFTCVVNRTGTIFVDGSSVGAMPSSWPASAVVCVAVDCSAKRIWFRYGPSGIWNNNAANDPATAVGGIAISLGAGIPLYPITSLLNTNDQVTANFGDSAFAGAVPAGFTSGFTAGASINTNMVATQTVMEQWGSGTPAMWATQVLIEHWASVADAAPVVPGGGDTRVMVLA